MSLLEYLAEYKAEHTQKITKLTHFIGIPSIIFAIEMVLILIHPSLVWFLLIAAFIFYLLMDVYIAVAIEIYLVLTTLILLYVVNHLTGTQSLVLALALFIFGWVMQLLGHYHEKNKPAFLKNLIQLIIGPFFLMAEVFFYFGYRKQLEVSISKRE